MSDQSQPFSDHRRWAFYNLGAQMCGSSGLRVHGPFRVSGDTHDRPEYVGHYPRLGYDNV